MLAALLLNPVAPIVRDYPAGSLGDPWHRQNPQIFDDVEIPVEEQEVFDDGVMDDSEILRHALKVVRAELDRLDLDEDDEQALLMILLALEDDDAKRRAIRRRARAATSAESRSGLSPLIDGHIESILEALEGLKR